MKDTVGLVQLSLYTKGNCGSFTSKAATDLRRAKSFPFHAHAGNVAAKVTILLHFGFPAHSWVYLIAGFRSCESPVVVHRISRGAAAQARPGASMASDADEPSDGTQNCSCWTPRAQPVWKINQSRLDAMDLMTLNAVPATLAALIRLDIFEALGRAGEGAKLTAEELAEQAMPGKAINVSYLERLLRMMSSHNVFSESVSVARPEGRPERRYGLQPIAQYFVKNEDGVSLAPLALMIQDKVFMATWHHLHEAVVDDSVQPFKRAHGMNAWEYGAQDARFDTVFNRAMADHSNLFMRRVLDAYDGFRDVQVLVDVGGGVGSSLALITARYPHIKGINFDQPHVIAACSQLHGVEHVSGDMFESVPFGDAIFMKWILHDWDDESNIKLLKNCHKALPAKGKVIVVDAVLPQIIDPDNPLSSRVAFRRDIAMLAYNSSGARERTEHELRALGISAGFAGVDVIVTVDSLAVMEMLKG